MSHTGIEGKVVLITGGTKGIGKAVVLAFRRAGAKVAINYSSDQSAADNLFKELGGEDHALLIKADAGSVVGAELMVQETIKQFGKIDILIPNAGTMHNVNLEDTTEKQFDLHYNVNVKGPYFLAQKAIPHMPEGSRIILLSTSLTVNSGITPNYLLYVSTKGAIEQITRVLAKELAPKSINVNAISPGPTGTDLFLQGKSEQLLNTIASSIPYKRIGKPEEVGDAFLFFASDAARWVTGQNLRVNGGMT